MNDNQPTKICSICGANYQGLGNNAWPVNTGRCCDKCNQIVVHARICSVRRGVKAYSAPEWYSQLVEDLRKLEAETEEK